MKQLLARILYSPVMLWIYQVWPLQMGIRVRHWVYRRLMSQADNVEFQEGILIKGMKNIRIGSGSVVHRSCSLYAQQGMLTVGSDCSLSSNVQLGAAQGEIIIGNKVMIGSNTVIRAANHRYNRTDIPMSDQGHESGRIVIEDDVWIASNAVIATGVTIGKGAVVGACAFVNKDVPPYTLVGGVPALPIKRRK